ncbi:hypothetical protein, partial [Neisseria bacilliformis]|uniref:hypothetical protein n=1 Tax=Neisseria bacilliformis TaxID=267212 RepID=UPI003C792C57
RHRLAFPPCICRFMTQNPLQKLNVNRPWGRLAISFAAVLFYSKNQAACKPDVGRPEAKQRQAV